MMRTEGASVELTIEDIAGRAGVDLAYVRRLVDLGALGPEGDGYREKDAHVTALLHMWEDAGLSAESILAAAESGELSLDFLESPGWELPPRLDRTYRELAEERSMPVDLLQAIQQAMGFVPPEPDDLARPDDVVIADLVRVALDIGGSGDAIRRLFRVYADNLRRLALAEADLYVEQIERPSRSAGTSEPELMRRGAGVGRDMAPLVKATVVFQDGDVYGRTVNLASRIADLAEAGDVHTTEETRRRVEDVEIHWARIGPAELQGVASPVTLYRASWGGQ
jgi:hypothetical protein